MANEIVFSTRGAESVGAAHDKIDARAKRTQQSYRLTGSEAKKFATLEQKLIRDTETARERYNRKLAESKMALAGNAREVELLKRVETQLKLEYSRSADANHKLAEARKKGAKDATVEEGKLHDAVVATKSETSAIGTTLSQVFSPARMLAYAGSFVGIHKAVTLVTDELRAQQEIIDKRAEAQLTVGEARNNLLRNLDENNPAQIRQVLAAADRIAGETGVSEVAIDNALASAVSSTGGDVDLATKLVELAAKYLKDRPGEVGEFAGSLADITRVTQSTDPEVQLGLLRRVGQLSRITSASQQATTIAPALIGTMPFGGSGRVSGSLFSALTGGAADKQGLVSGTALIGLAKQLDDLAKGKGVFKETKQFSLSDEQKQRMRTGGFFVGDLGTRVDFLMENQDLAQTFLDKGSFEKKLAGPVRQLLTDATSKVAKDYRGNLSQIPDNAGLDRIGEEALGIFEQFNTLEPVAERKRRFKSTVERLRTRQATDRLSTEELEDLRGIALETGSTSLGAKFDQFIARVEGGGTVRVDSAISQLERRAEELENPVIPGSPYSNMNARPDVAREATPEERESARLLREAVKHLSDGAKSQAETAKILRNSRGGILIGNE